MFSAIARVFRTPDLRRKIAFTLGIMLIFFAALSISSEWEFGAKLVPHVVGWTAVFILSALIFVMLFYQKEPRKAHTAAGTGDEATQEEDESDEWGEDMAEDEPDPAMQGTVQPDGYEYLEWPSDSEEWWYREDAQVPWAPWDEDG